MAQRGVRGATRAPSFPVSLVSAVGRRSDAAAAPPGSAQSGMGGGEVVSLHSTSSEADEGSDSEQQLLPATHRSDIGRYEADDYLGRYGTREAPLYSDFTSKITALFAVQ